MSEPRQCEILGCGNFAEPGETICIDHRIAAFVIRALDIDPATLPPGCLHPVNCQAKAHHPGDPISPDFRHCEICRG